MAFLDCSTFCEHADYGVIGARVQDAGPPDADISVINHVPCGPGLVRADSAVFTTVPALREGN